MKNVFALIAVAGIAWGLTPAFASTEGGQIHAREWPHKGVLGSFDKPALRRGFQVYREVCSACHGLKYIAFRNITALGYSADEVKAIAAEYDVEDGPNDDGEMYFRSGVASDRLPGPFANEQAARASNNGALPPDLSLIIKARPGAEDYLHAVLTGYADPPEDFELADGMNYNPFFDGAQIAMAQPLFEEAVEYDDGTPATVDQMASDVTTFLAWAAEPTLEARKRMGFQVMIYLAILTVLMFFVNKRVWKKLK